MIADLYPFNSEKVSICPHWLSMFCVGWWKMKQIGDLFFSKSRCWLAWKESWTQLRKKDVSIPCPPHSSVPCLLKAIGMFPHIPACTLLVALSPVLVLWPCSPLHSGTWKLETVKMWTFCSRANWELSHKTRQELKEINPVSRKVKSQLYTNKGLNKRQSKK